jgi:sulfatase modifying factor 1
MKKLLILCLVTTPALLTFSQSASFSGKDFKNNYAELKANVFYVGKYEVTNLDYRNFLSGLLEEKQTAAYQKALPDTLCWNNGKGYNQPYAQYYFRDKPFDNYPVVGISYEQAKAYCDWLTAKYNRDPKKKFKQVQFRLLTRDEWIYAANKGDSSKVYTWGSGFIKNNRGQYLCNFRYVELVYDSVTKKYNEAPPRIDPDKNAVISGPVNSFFPNSFGIYNMCGNVAEMTAEKGVARGGSYNDPSWNVRILSEKAYLKPAADIGFRVAMMVIQE